MCQQRARRGRFHLGGYGMRLLNIIEWSETSVLLSRVIQKEKRCRIGRYFGNWNVRDGVSTWYASDRKYIQMFTFLTPGSIESLTQVFSLIEAVFLTTSWCEWFSSTIYNLSRKKNMPRKLFDRSQESLQLTTPHKIRRRIQGTAPDLCSKRIYHGHLKPAIVRLTLCCPQYL